MKPQGLEEVGALDRQQSYLVVGLLSTASFLVVDDIVVRGNDQLSEAEVLALVSGLVGENILTVDLEPYRQRFSESPWLRGWTLRRILPSTVDVQVTERRPVAIAPAHTPNQVPDLRINPWSFATTAFPTPVISETLPMPAYNCFWLHDMKGLSPIHPNL